jgi:hypothetical protein
MDQKIVQDISHNIQDVLKAIQGKRKPLTKTQGETLQGAAKTLATLAKKARELQLNQDVFDRMAKDTVHFRYSTDYLYEFETRGDTLTEFRKINMFHRIVDTQVMSVEEGRKLWKELSKTTSKTPVA